jgi:hypothetical protein
MSVREVIMADVKGFLWDVFGAIAIAALCALMVVVAVVSGGEM